MNYLSKKLAALFLGIALLTAPNSHAMFQPRVNVNTRQEVSPTTMLWIGGGVLGVVGIYNIACVWQAYDLAYAEYAPFIDILNKPNMTEEQVAKEIKRAILMNQDGTNPHPLASFITKLNSHLTYLGISAFFSRGNEHANRVNALKQRIICIRKFVVNDPEYREEARSQALVSAINNVANKPQWNHNVNIR